MPNLVFRPIEMGLIQSGDSQIAQVCESMLSLYKNMCMRSGDEDNEPCCVTIADMVTQQVFGDYRMGNG